MKAPLLIVEGRGFFVRARQRAEGRSMISERPDGPGYRTTSTHPLYAAVPSGRVSR